MFVKNRYNGNCVKHIILKNILKPIYIIFKFIYNNYDFVYIRNLYAGQIQIYYNRVQWAITRNVSRGRLKKSALK